MEKSRNYGIIIALISSVLWGISGNLAEYIFIHSNIDVITAVRFRLVYSGIILLLYGIHLNGINKLKEMLKNSKIMKRIIIYAILGILALQASFFKTIELSNAPFATLVQFLAPLIILIIVNIRIRKLPKFFEVFYTILALLGMFLMITSGNINSLKVSLEAIFMGIFSAFTFVFYILYAKKLFNYPTTLVIGSGMLIGGILLTPFINLPLLIREIRSDLVIAFWLNIIFGTVIPFYLFLESIRYVSPKITSLISAFEPLTALIIGVFYFKNNLDIIQIIGGLIIIVSVTILSILDAK